MWTLYSYMYSDHGHSIKSLLLLKNTFMCNFAPTTNTFTHSGIQQIYTNDYNSHTKLDCIKKPYCWWWHIDTDQGKRPGCLDHLLLWESQEVSQELLRSRGIHIIAPPVRFCCPLGNNKGTNFSYPLPWTNKESDLWGIAWDPTAHEGWSSTMVRASHLFHVHSLETWTFKFPQ